MCLMMSLQASGPYSRRLAFALAGALALAAALALSAPGARRNAGLVGQEGRGEAGIRSGSPTGPFQRGSPPQPGSAPELAQPEPGCPAPAHAAASRPSGG